MAIQPLKSNILETPLEIYEVAIEYFPGLKATVISGSNASLKLELILANNLLPLILGNAVDKEIFSGKLSMLSVECLFCSKEDNIESVNFSVALPLTNVLNFKCLLHERKNKKCEDVIIEYLRGANSNFLKLNKLGLSPEQVDNTMPEDLMVYFRKAMDKVCQLELDKREPLFTTFESKYPHIFARLLSEMVNEQVESTKPKNDDYKITLEQLRRRVFGQNHAIEVLASHLASQKNQFSNKVFLFAGPSGVGKTKLAKAAAEIKAGAHATGVRFIPFQMNQYSGEYDVTKLFGASAGLVGSTDKPHFANEIEKCNPVLKSKVGSTSEYDVENVVILFDELEKASQEVQKALLTLLDEGHCTVFYTLKGENVALKYLFSKCIFVSTSNLCQDLILNGFVHKKSVDEITTDFKIANTQMYSRRIGGCAPELVARMTVVPFGPIPQGEVYQGLIKSEFETFCKDLKKECAFREVVIEATEERFILASLEKILYGNGTDIRKIKNYFDDVIKTRIYQSKIKWGDLKNIRILFSRKNDRVVLKVEVFLVKMNRYGLEPFDTLIF